MERAVAEVIARHMNPDGIAWPGYELIAEEAGVTPKSVQKATKILVGGAPSRGVLPLYTRRRRHDERGRPKSYEYRLVEHPEALLKARSAGMDRLKNLEAILSGAAANEMEMELDAKTRAAAEDLRRREVELQSLLINEKVSEVEYDKRLRALKAQRSLLARAFSRGPAEVDS